MDISLRERTVVILGSAGPTLQNVVMGLAQEGADVALIDPEGRKMERFCQNVTDQREINAKFGRAGVFPFELGNLSSLKDALGKAAQTFGGIEIYIDALGTNTPSPFSVGGDGSSAVETAVQNNLMLSLKATEIASGFLKTRKRGRIIYLMNDSLQKGLPADALAAAARTGLVAFAKALSRQMQEFSTTVNCLSLALSEEYLMGHLPEASSIKEALEKVRAVDTGAKITEPEKVMQTLLFLCGSTGASMTGQHLTLN